MKVNREVTIELTAQDVKEAVASWLSGRPPFDMHFEPSEIHLSTEVKYIGNGAHESKIHVPVVKAVQYSPTKQEDE